MIGELTCFCLDNWSVVLSIGITYGLGIIVYLFLLFIARRYLGRTPGAKRVINRLSIWIFLFFLEVATIVSVNFITTESRLIGDLSRLIVVAIILTIMMSLISLARSLFLNRQQQLMERASVDYTARGTLTQTLFIYRLVVLGIIFLSCGVIFIVFPYIRSIGIGILGSAGIVGIAVGIAAKPVLLNMIVGFQIGFNKMIKIGDRINVKGHLGVIENIWLTRIVLKMWDNRRILIPISQLIDGEVESHDIGERHSIGAVMLYLDYSAPMEPIREKFDELVTEHPLFDGHFKSVIVSDLKSDCIEVRLAMSSTNYNDLFNLRAFIREEMIGFLQKEHPESLPSQRLKNFQTPAEQL